MITPKQLVNGGNNISSSYPQGVTVSTSGSDSVTLFPKGSDLKPHPQSQSQSQSQSIQVTPLQLDVPQGVFGSQSQDVSPIRQYSILPPIGSLAHNAIDSFSNAAVGAVNSQNAVGAVSDTIGDIGNIGNVVSENLQQYTPQVSVEPSYNQEIPSARKFVFPPRQSVNRRPKWNSNF